MTSLGDVLELLHGAGRSFETARMVAVHRLDTAASQRAMERWRTNARRRTARMYSTSGDDETPPVREWTTRAWVERPDRVREEVDGENARYGVRVGEKWWLYSEHSGALTNDGDPDHGAGIGQELQALLDPSPLIPLLDFELADETEAAGRRALHVRGRPRKLFESHLFVPGLNAGADGVDLLVDSERGVLLRLASFLDGDEISAIGVRELAFGERFDPSTFVFVPPEGEELQRTSERHQLRDLPLEEVGRRASFAVFAATGLDAGWRLRARHLKPDRAQRTEQVHLGYSRDDAAHSFGINEQRADDAHFFTTVAAPERVERDGREYFVVHPHDDSPLAAVRLTLDGTVLELISDNLAATALLAIAAGLKRMS